MPTIKPLSPGKLYAEIKVEREAFKESGELEREVDPSFVRFCKSIHRRFPGLGTGARYTEEYAEAIAFLGWKLSAEEFNATVKFVTLAALLVGVLAGIGVFVFLGEALAGLTGTPELVFLYVFAPVIIVSLALTNWVQKKPLHAAKDEQVRALTYVPELMGYMIMSMKLVPNLEKSVEFAAEHGQGRVALEFKRMIWDVQLGVYNTLTEALDEMAYRWGKYSSEFKESLMMVRASVLENTEAKRNQLLDKTMDKILESVRLKMEQYARDLSQPVTVLFYVGVLLPLILIIILPVGSSFSGAPLARADILFVLYNILIPALVLWVAITIIKQRPPTYVPPPIDDRFPGLPPKGMLRVGESGMLSIALLVVAVLLLGAGASAYLHFNGLGIALPADKTRAQALQEDGLKPENWYDLEGPRHKQLLTQGYSEEKALEILVKEEKRFFSISKNDITPYNLVFGLLITLSIGAYVALHFGSVYKRRAQERIMAMESEFKDSLYILASRLGENKPVEDALRHTKDFLPKSVVAQELFGKTVDNINLLGMPLEAALFDPSYGSLKYNPSSTIRSSMKIMIDSVKLGVNVSARSMAALSRQLANTESVNRSLKILLSDITTMMNTMALFIGPIVLGITAALQRIVIITLASVNVSSEDIVTGSQPNLQTLPGIPDIGAFSGSNVSKFINPQGIQSLATPDQFLIIVALYVIELVIIMTYFTTRIEEDNELTFKLQLAKGLPIAVILFVVTVIVSNRLVAGVFSF